MGCGTIVLQFRAESAKNWMGLKGTQGTRITNEQDEAENCQKLVNEGGWQLQELARKAHAKTREKDDDKEPTNET